MSILTGKKILIGVTGSIAAYKSAVLVRLLVKQGAEVKVVMTEWASKFITPLTLSTLSKNPVHTGLVDNNSWVNHVELGLWADVFIIAPLSAGTLSKMACGACDNLLTAVYLSAKCPVVVAPAMDLDMWKHAATQENIKKIQAYGNKVIPVGTGELASGLHGEGRMAEPEEIVRYLERFFTPVEQPLLGNSILITAGPTYEPLDPVRFIGNRSSGKMGVALAEQAANRGAEVFLILGPSRENPPSLPNLHLERVETAQEMYEAATGIFPKIQIAILAAAVSDFKPSDYHPEKIKKKTGQDTLTIILEKNPDIALALGKMKRPDQKIIGFALETQEEETNALEKLHKKNFDFIVLNSLKDKGAGFEHDTNKITILHKNGEHKSFALKSKADVAGDILNELETL